MIVTKEWLLSIAGMFSSKKKENQKMNNANEETWKLMANEQTWKLLQSILENPYLWTPVSELKQLQGEIDATSLESLIVNECISDVYLTDEELKLVNWQEIADELNTMDQRESSDSLIKPVSELHLAFYYGLPGSEESESQNIGIFDTDEKAWQAIHDTIKEKKETGDNSYFIRDFGVEIMWLNVRQSLDEQG